MLLLRPCAVDNCWPTVYVLEVYCFNILIVTVRPIGAWIGVSDRPVFLEDGTAVPPKHVAVDT
jgi:hypothetical protein